MALKKKPPIHFNCNCKILACKYGDDICRYYEKRESERLHKFDLELEAILISVFINRDMKLNCACACVFAITSG